MADFCKQCSIQMFNHDYKELAGLLSDQDDPYVDMALCETCGYVAVNENGECVDPACAYHGSCTCLKDPTITCIYHPKRDRPRR